MARTLCTLLTFFLLGKGTFSQEINWKSLNEPGNGGRSTDVAIDPKNPDHVLVSGDMLGLALSIDGGSNWLPTFGFNSYELGAISFHPTDSSVVWVGSMSGPFKSMDGGLNWTLKREGMGPIQEFYYSSPIEVVLFDPIDANRLLAFGGSKRDWNNRGTPRYNIVWESLNGGESWTILSTVGVESRPGITSASFLSDTTLVVAARKQGVYLSEDRGRSWRRSIEGMPDSADIFHVAVDPQNSNILYASLNNYLSGDTYLPGGIFKSMDRGQTWVETSDGLMQVSHSNPNSASHYTTVKVSSTDSNILYTSNIGWSGAGVFKSTDSGASWEPILNKSNTNNFPHAFFDAAGPGMEVFDIDSQNPDIYIGAGSSYVFRTSDGGTTWEDLMSRPTQRPDYFTGNGFCGLVGRNAEFNPFDPDHVVLQSMDNGKFVHSDDGMQSWKRDGEGMTNYRGGNDVAFASAEIMYATTGQSDFDGVWKSVDQGHNWIKFDLSLFPGASAASRPLGIHTLPANPDRVWVVLDNKLYYSENGGSSWGSLLEVEGLNYIAASSQNPANFYLNSADGVYQTLDGLVFDLLPNSPSSGHKLRVDPNNQEILYVTKWRTNDGLEGLWKYSGGTWERIFEDYYSSGIAIQPGNSEVLLLGTTDPPFHDIMNSTGIWLSIDGGVNWIQQNQGLPLLRADVISFNPHRPEQVLSGTQGRGFFVGNLELPVSTSELLENVPFKIFPNPTSGIVQIKVPSPTYHFYVLDLNGRRVYTHIAKQEFFEWDLTKLPAGLYLLQAFDRKSGRRFVEKLIKR